MADAAEAEEFGVAAGDLEPAGAGEIDEDIGREAADVEAETEELADGARAGGVAHVIVDEAGVLKHGGGRRGLGGDGQVGEEAALGVRERTGDEVEAGKSDEGVAEAAEAVDEDAVHWRHSCKCRG